MVKIVRTLKFIRILITSDKRSQECNIYQTKTSYNRLQIGRFENLHIYVCRIWMYRQGQVTKLKRRPLDFDQVIVTSS